MACVGWTEGREGEHAADASVGRARTCQDEPRRAPHVVPVCHLVLLPSPIQPSKPAFTPAPFVSLSPSPTTTYYAFLVFRPHTRFTT